MHHFIAMICSMKPEHLLGTVIAILFAVPMMTALALWIFSKVERAMKTMAGNDDGKW